jgi:hypothetical protein
VLEDRSGRHTPDQWAREACVAYYKWKADRVVAEVNQGFDLVEKNLRTVDQNLPFKAIHASRGKVTRAEPISALYEQRRVSHVGLFCQLEDQMVSFLCDAPRKGGSHDDRVDALCYSLTELMVQPIPGANIIEYYRRLVEAEGNGTSLTYSAPPTLAPTPLLWPTPAAKAVEQTVTLRAPANILDGTQPITQSGKALHLAADRTVVVSREDATALRIGGWQQVQVEPVA